MSYPLARRCDTKSSFKGKPPWSVAMPTRTRFLSRSAIRLLLENLYKFQVAIGDQACRGLASDLALPPLDQRIPKTRPADGETNEAGHGGGGCQPMAHLGIVLTPAQDDAADSCPAATPRG